MALEQFIEITGVVGEASAPDVRSAIPVLSWSFALTESAGPGWGAPPVPGAAESNPAERHDAPGPARTPAASAPSDGVVTFSGFCFTKRVDSSTPVLMDLCARRTSSSQARLVVRNTGQRVARVVVDLRDVVVAEISASFDPASADLLEAVVLRFERVWFGGAVVDRRGASEQVNWFAWDVRRNRPATTD